MTAYLIDSSITPLHFMASADLIVTSRAREHLIEAGWTPPPPTVTPPPYLSDPH